MSMKVLITKGNDVLVDTTKPKVIQKEVEEGVKSEINLFSKENQEQLKTKFKINHSASWEILKSKTYAEMTQQEFQLYQKLRHFYPDETNATHISNGFDTHMFPNGFIDGELYIISGLSGRGKTSLCTMLTACAISGNNPFLNAEKSFQQRNVIYITLEQTKKQIIMRIASTLSFLNNPENALPYANLLTGNVTSEEAELLCYDLFNLYKCNLQIISFSDLEEELTVENIMSKILQYIKIQKENPLVFIDQYENIEGASNPQNDEVARKLKIFAEHHSIPLIMQAQLNKNAVSRIETKAPTGNCLRGTSGLEHQASGIIIMTPEEKEKQIYNHTAELLRFDLVKSRYSARASCHMWHLGAFNMFLDCDEEELTVKRERKKKGDENKKVENS